MVELVLVVVIDWVLVRNVRQLVPRDNNNSEGNFQPQRKYMEGWLRLGALGTGNYNITKWDNTQTSREQSSKIQRRCEAYNLELKWHTRPFLWEKIQFNFIDIVYFNNCIILFSSSLENSLLLYSNTSNWTKMTKDCGIFVMSSHNCPHISWYVTRSNFLHFLQP